MRHRKDGRQFARNTSHRRAMFRNLAANLFTHERIVTTDAKAKELRRVAERLITKAKRLGSAAHTPQADLSDSDKARRLHVQRQLAAFLPRFGVERDGVTKRDLVEKVLVDLSQRFAERPGGYTRIIKIGARRGDNAEMSIIELVDAPPVDAIEADLEEAAAPAEDAPAEAAEATEVAAADETAEEEEGEAEADAEADAGDDADSEEDGDSDE